MLLEKTNIGKVLADLKLKKSNSKDIYKESNEIFKAKANQKIRIRQNIVQGISGDVNKFDFDLLEHEKIYHLNHIKKTCIDYRLRFLDSKYFKGDIPLEAVAKIKQLEKQHGIELKGFKIIAPSRLFKLKDKDDPLLFASMGNNYFYFIHKWGNDLHPLRKVLMWPFKNIVNLALLVFVLSYLLTLIVPMDLFTRSKSGFEFWILFFFMFKSIAAVVIFYGFALGKNFNPAIWNSKYFNSWPWITKGYILLIKDLIWNTI